MKKLSSLVFGISFVLSATLAIAPAHAQTRFRAGHTQNGAAGAVVNQGQYGTQGCVGGARYGVSAGSACGVNATGANGSTVNGGRYKGYQAGTGAVSGGSYDASTAKGNFSSDRSSTYNAQTGAGNRATSRSADVNKDGQSDYSYNANTTYQRGQGGTSTVNTQNKGTYTCQTGTGCSNTQP